jgi:sugar phosphate permease
VNWFPLKYYAHMTGVLLAVGGVGSIVAQGPLASLADSMGWRACFYGIGGIGGLLAILCLIFVRGNPEALDFLPVNSGPRMSMVTGEMTLGERFAALWVGFKTVVSLKWFWITVLYCVFANGAWFDISGMWIAPFLEDIFEYTKQEAGNASMALSIGLIAGSLCIPPLSSWFRTRKWILCATSVVAFAISLSFWLVAAPNIPYAGLYVMLVLLGASTNAMTAVAYPLMREYFYPEIAGSAVGCANTFTFLSSAVYQSLTSEVIKDYKVESEDGTTVYSRTGYMNALWAVCTVSFVAAVVAIACTRDTVFAPLKAVLEDEEEEAPEAVKDESRQREEGQVLDEL